MKTIRLFLLCLIFAAAAHAQSPENILLVLNESSPVSLEVGQYYAQKRGIPAQNILRIKTAQTDEISREDFTRQIEAPIGLWLTKNSAQDRILYFVLTKGIPLRVAGTGGENGTIASVDSELTMLYSKLLGMRIPIEGKISNPYYLKDGAVQSAHQFTHQSLEIYLVSRLDGYTVADIRGLIDRGYAPAKEGKILLDQKGSSNGKGDDWLLAAAERLRGNGFADRVVLDSGSNVLKDMQGVLGYYSWGSNDPAIRIRHFGLGFLPGALAAMYVSSDGRTFSEPPANWNLGTWEDKSTHFGGSPQSLAGDLIRDGVTGAAGHVAEPFLEYTIRPNILFPAYFSGFNLIESYYMAMPALSWQTVVVGDPLCAPFRTKSLTPQEIDKGIDPDTELPGYFSARRLRLVAASPVRPGAVDQEVTKLLLRAEVRIAKQNLSGAQQDLEEATARDKGQIAAQALLAQIYEQNKEFDKADARYRATLDWNPDNWIALNNLAYSMAVRHKSPKEALPLAERAYKASKGDANVADTLGWIYHLTGDNEKARGLLEAAARSVPENAEVHLHLAIVSADLSQTLQASAELDRALKLDPKLETSEEVKQLRAKIKSSTQSRMRLARTQALEN
jgi:uncharacterized protein (TIGR03790 family)